MQARLTGLNHNEALAYLGYRGGALPPDAAADIARCEALLIKTVRPRAVWRRFALTPDGGFEGVSFRPEGGDVPRLLFGCEAVICFAATLGMEFEALMRRTQARSMAEAVVLDACGSAAIENVCDNLCGDLAAAEAPLCLTDRFSPGYGDFPLTQQHDFCAMLDAQRRVGITLSDSGLMTPQKSVTALLGVRRTPPEKRARGCAYCGRFADCTYRKDGITCG